MFVTFLHQKIRKKSSDYMSKKKKETMEETIADEQVQETAGEVNENGADDQAVEAQEESQNTAETCEDKEDEITLLKKMWEELNDKHLRLQAEFDNYRRRTLKEKMELTKSAGEGILVNILPVMDDFERALDHVSKSDDVESLKEGFGLIYSKFEDFLKRNSVVEIETKDVDFDTDVHEAITKIPVQDEGMKGKIVDCVQKGYKLNDKVIRFSKVVIGD